MTPSEKHKQIGVLCAGTPTLTVLDARRLMVRQVAYHRSPEEQSLTKRITQHRYDAAGRLMSSIDPKLFNTRAARPNLVTSYSLSGRVLHTDSVDAGWRAYWYGAAGQLLQTVDARGTRTQTQYDPLLRPVATYEKIHEDKAKRCVQRFIYGESEKEEVRNRRGRLIRHDDPAGTLTISGYGLTGQPLDETRRFLKTLDAPNWPDKVEERDMLLEEDNDHHIHTTYWTHNALGERMAQTDARKNHQNFTYNITGQLKESRVQLAGQSTSQILVSGLDYNAFGQLLREKMASGVTTEYTYDPANQHLIQLCATRPEAPTLLQDLQYHYDPVGNITEIKDAAKEAKYFKNQKVDPVLQYQYDTLYQLTRATGRESVKANAVRHSANLLDRLPIVNDDSVLVKYEHIYTYDEANNLKQVKHSGSAPLKMAVSLTSNRAVPQWEETTSAEVGRHFDGNGNPLSLLSADVHVTLPLDACGTPIKVPSTQKLFWDASNQLQRVVQFHREGGNDDDECYVYDGGGQRVRKVRRWQAKGITHTEQVRYLPGLEIRENSARKESIQTLTLGGGRCAIRILHWDTAPPKAIKNDQFRYSLNNHLGSSTLELDQAADILSYEEYYPFGGTAIWAAKSQIEAKYKVVRYSGKERDATGLYYYGYRYYAPWLGRWLNPDPAGTVDGLNLFAMVGNNPISRSDPMGLYGIADWLDLPNAPDPERVRKVVSDSPGVHDAYVRFSEETAAYLGVAEKNTMQFKDLTLPKQRKALQEKKLVPRDSHLKDLNALAAVFNIRTGEYQGEFVNLPGKLGGTQKFSGIKSGDGTYSITDHEAFIGAIEKAYGDSGLHKGVGTLTRLHIAHTERSNEGNLSNFYGIPALHAEVQAFNHSRKKGMNPADCVIFTKRLVTNNLGKAGDDFPACFNCDALLSLVHVTTGRATSDKAHAMAQRTNDALMRIQGLERKYGDLAFATKGALTANKLAAANNVLAARPRARWLSLRNVVQSGRAAAAA